MLQRRDLFVASCNNKSYIRVGAAPALSSCEGEGLVHRLQENKPLLFTSAAIDPVPLMEIFSLRQLHHQQM